MKNLIALIILFGFGWWMVGLQQPPAVKERFAGSTGPVTYHDLVIVLDSSTLFFDGDQEYLDSIIEVYKPLIEKK